LWEFYGKREEERGRDERMKQSLKLLMACHLGILITKMLKKI
jgi:hypothetical protein